MGVVTIDLIILPRLGNTLYIVSHLNAWRNVIALFIGSCLCKRITYVYNEQSMTFLTAVYTFMHRLLHAKDICMKFGKQSLKIIYLLQKNFKITWRQFLKCNCCFFKTSLGYTNWSIQCCQKFINQKLQLSNGNRQK